MATAFFAGGLRLRPDILGRLTSEGQRPQRAQSNGRCQWTCPSPRSVDHLLGTLHRWPDRHGISEIDHYKPPVTGGANAPPSVSMGGESKAPDVAVATLTSRVAPAIASPAMSTPVTP